MITRGDVCWTDLGPARGSRPAKRRPVVVVSSDSYNASRLATALVAVITSNVALAAMPGNLFLPSVDSGLPRDSAVNVTALVTVDKALLGARVGSLSSALLAELDRGLRLVLGV